MTTCTLLVGAPGSGKSHYARTMRSQHCIVLDRSDYLVSMTGMRIYWRSSTQIADSMIECAYQSALKCQLDLIVMDWGKTPQGRARWLRPAIDAGYRTRIIYLATSPEVCLSRIQQDSARSKTTRWKRLIDHFYRDFVPIEEHEADEICTVVSSL